MPRPESIILIADGQARPEPEALDVAGGLANVDSQIEREEKEHELKMQKLRTQREALEQRLKEQT